MIILRPCIAAIVSNFVRLLVHAESYAPSGHHNRNVDTVLSDISTPQLCDYIHAVKNKVDASQLNSRFG